MLEETNGKTIKEAFVITDDKNNIIAISEDEKTTKEQMDKHNSLNIGMGGNTLYFITNPKLRRIIKKVL